MGYNPLINGVYWGYNLLTILLLTSWDIQAPQLFQLGFAFFGDFLRKVYHWTRQKWDLGPKIFGTFSRHLKQIQVSVAVYETPCNRSEQKPSEIHFFSAKKKDRGYFTPCTTIVGAIFGYVKSLAYIIHG